MDDKPHRNALCRGRALVVSTVVLLAAFLVVAAGPGLGIPAAAQSRDMVDADEADALVRAGIAKANERLTDEAVDLFGRSIQLRKRNPAAYYNRGKVYLIQRRPDLAIHDLDRALKLDPQLAGAYEARGMAHKLRGEFVHAVKDFTTAIKIEPASITALMNRASIYFDAGAPDLALVDLTEVVRINPGMLKALGNRAAIYEQLGMFDEAVADLTHVLVLDTSNVSAMTHLGSVLAKRGDPKKAARWFRLALTMEQDEAVRNNLKAELQRIEPRHAPN